MIYCKSKSQSDYHVLYAQQTPIHRHRTQMLTILPEPPLCSPYRSPESRPALPGRPERYRGRQWQTLFVTSRCAQRRERVGHVMAMLECSWNGGPRKGIVYQRRYRRGHESYDIDRSLPSFSLASERRMIDNG